MYMSDASYVLELKYLESFNERLGLSQENYLQKILESLWIDKSKPVNTIAEKWRILSLNDCPRTDK